MGNHGVKIKNIKAGSLYEYNLGARKTYESKNALFTNSLLLDFLLSETSLNVKNGFTRDIVCIEFSYGSRGFDDAIKAVDKKIKKMYKDSNELSEKEEEKIRALEDMKRDMQERELNFIKKSVEDIRKEYYEDGVIISYNKTNKQNEIVSTENIKYKMLYRSTGKAKKGSCMFINEKLYKKAKDYMSMYIKIPDKNAPIVEMSAYSPMVASSMIDKVQLDPRNILILKDVDCFFKTNIVSVETDENKHCIAKNIENYNLKNTLFDGQAIIDSSKFPEWADGYILMRQHMTKMASFEGHIQKFYKDYFGDKYETAIVYDMWDNPHYAKDIEMITTDNAMKWLKFGISYEYWCEKVLESGGMFGIVKTAHESKLGSVQRMSYQMVNALDNSIMANVVKKSKDYIELLKKDDNVFLQYLSDNKTFSNDYEVLVALCGQNMDFTRSEYFRSRKYEIIKGYINNFRFGKVIQEADNLVIVGSPYAMLLHSVNEDVYNDDTLKVEDGAIQCFTERFKDGEYLACFRSPFNSKNNMGYLHNVHSDKIKKYFDFGRQIIVVNLIGTDFQDRQNGLT